MGNSDMDDNADPSPTDRNDSGRFVANHDVTPESVLDVLEPLEPYMTGEVAELVGVPRRTVFDYLDKLAEEGLIRKKKPEGRRVVWIKPENGEQNAEGER